MLRLSTRANARVIQVSTYGTKLKEVLTLGVVPVPRRHSPSESPAGASLGASISSP